MPDFDVQALSLASPPSAAPVTTYRPAVRVRNNGMYPADVTGYLRIYRREPPGELLATHQLSLLNLGAGLEGDALSSGYWTPTTADVGREYLFTAHVDTDRDQNTGNNDLSPVTVIVTAGQPPPPPSVLAHATQHESGGADQVEITGLHGLAADAQTALAHKASHQAGGADAMNVDGLMGTLAEGQPIADHHESHEDGGGDELYVGGLRGTLADNQPAIVHDNAKHDPNYATVTEHNNHLTDTTAVHEVATNLEQVANKGAANGYPSLAANGYVPPAQLGINPVPTYILMGDQSFVRPRFAYPNARRISGTSYVDPLIEVNRNSAAILLDVTLPAGSLELGACILIRGLALHRGQPTARPTLYLDLKENGFGWTMGAATLLCNKTPPLWPAYELIRFAFRIPLVDYAGQTRWQAWAEAITSDEHSIGFGDYYIGGAGIFDPTNSLELHVRMSEPDIPDSYGQSGPIELSVHGAAVL